MPTKKNETEKASVAEVEAEKTENETVFAPTLYDKAKAVGINSPERYPEEVLKNEISARELVTIQLPKDHMQYKYDLKITNPITKELMIIKRGVPVKVPRCVKDIIDQATEQAEFAYQQQEELAQRYADEAKVYTKN